MLLEVILGASSFICPLSIGIESIIDLMILIVGCIGVLFILNDFRIKRYEGISMLIFYLSYCVYIFIR